MHRSSHYLPARGVTISGDEQFEPLIRLDPPATFAIGQRVQTLIELQSADWAPEQPDLPVGSLGTVDHIFYRHDFPSVPSGYGVMLDGSVDRLSAWMGPQDIEAVTDQGEVQQ